MGSVLKMAALKVVAVLLLAVASNAKPNLGVYYESLCPYSRQFIREEVWPAYQVLAEYFDVEFVAYGNARTTGSMESGFSIECQHGEQECVGNVVQACTVKCIFSTVCLQLPAHKLLEQFAFKSLGLTMTRSRLVQTARRDKIFTSGMEKFTILSAQEPGDCPGLPGMVLVVMMLLMRWTPWVWLDTFASTSMMAIFLMGGAGGNWRELREFLLRTNK